MSSRKPHTVYYRRKRKQKTNYKKRLNLLKSKEIRLVIRKSLNNLTVQFVEYKQGGDKVLLSVRGDSLKKLKWTFSQNNIPASYLIGLIASNLHTASCAHIPQPLQSCSFICTFHFFGLSV